MEAARGPREIMMFVTLPRSESPAAAQLRQPGVYNLGYIGCSPLCLGKTRAHCLAERGRRKVRSLCVSLSDAVNPLFRVVARAAPGAAAAAAALLRSEVDYLFGIGRKKLWPGGQKGRLIGEQIIWVAARG